MWTEFERPVKVFARKQFFDSKRRAASSYLTLPGRDCVDILAGLKEGYISDNTIIQAVEKNEVDWMMICDVLAKHHISSQTHLWHGHLYNYTPIQPLDLVFLDYNGCITASDAYWQRNVLSQSILPGAKIGITLNPNKRNNHFIKALSRMCRNHDGFHSFVSRTSNRMSISLRSRKAKEDAALYSMLLQDYCFAGFDFNVEFYKYKDTCPMYLVILSDLQPKEPVLTERSNNIAALVVWYSANSTLRFQTSDVFFQVPSLGEDTMTFQEVVEKCVKAEHVPSPQNKAWATMYKKKYIENRVAETGSKPSRVEAAIKAAVTRRLTTV